MQAERYRQELVGRLQPTGRLSRLHQEVLAAGHDAAQAHAQGAGRHAGGLEGAVDVPNPKPNVHAARASEHTQIEARPAPAPAQEPAPPPAHALAGVLGPAGVNPAQPDANVAARAGSLAGARAANAYVAEAAAAPVAAAQVHAAAAAAAPALGAHAHEDAPGAAVDREHIRGELANHVDARAPMLEAQQVQTAQLQPASAGLLGPDRREGAFMAANDVADAGRRAHQRAEDAAVGQAEAMPVVAAAIHEAAPGPRRRRAARAVGAAAGPQGLALVRTNGADAAAAMPEPMQANAPLPGHAQPGVLAPLQDDGAHIAAEQRGEAQPEAGVQAANVAMADAPPAPALAAAAAAAGGAAAPDPPPANGGAPHAPAAAAAREDAAHAPLDNAGPAAHAGRGAGAEEPAQELGNTPGFDPDQFDSAAVHLPAAYRLPRHMLRASEDEGGNRRAPRDMAPACL